MEIICHKMPTRGFYIILEGGEGCGKSTQAKLLVECLNSNGYPCERGREPGGVKEAEKIREVLLDKKNDLCSETELFLFEAARAEFFRQEVIPKLNKGVTIIADRSGYSSLAYQGYGGGVDLGLIKKLNEVATFKVKPNLTFIINIDPFTGLKKEQNSDRFEAKGIEYHQRVNQGYLEIAKEDSENFVIIPYREGNPLVMHKQIKNVLKEKLKF